MAKTAKDYPVQYPYGYSKAYGGWHTGEDRPCPWGTPLVINGVEVAKTGNSGYVLPAPTPSRPKAGAHLHVGKYAGGVSHNPNGQGFTFREARVTEIGRDGRNGLFVRVQADGYSWVYLHLSSTSCKVGQALKVKTPINIPILRKFYTVQRGDTVDAISRKFGLDRRNNYQGFRQLNPGVKNINWIYAGQKVRVK